MGIGDVVNVGWDEDGNVQLVKVIEAVPGGFEQVYDLWNGQIVEVLFCKTGGLHSPALLSGGPEIEEPKCVVVVVLEVLV